MTAYYQRDALRQRYLHRLDEALADQRLDVQQHVWLQAPPGQVSTPGADPMRVDRLVLGDGANRSFELSAALLLSHGQTDYAWVWLYTLESGVQGFVDRHALLAELNRRFAEDAAQGSFEYEEIVGDPFHAQMLAIVDHQVERVGQLTAQLRLIPSLLNATAASLAEQLRRHLPHMAIDPEVHPLQLVCEKNPDAIAAPCTLARAAFDDYRNVPRAAGLKRVFLNAEGAVASDSDAALFSRSLVDATAGLGKRYGTLLQAYWQGIWAWKRTRRDLAIDCLSDRLRHALYGLHHTDVLSTSDLHALLALMQSGVASSTWRYERLSVTIGDGPECLLAGSFVARNHAGTGALLWFCANHESVVFADLQAMALYFETEEGRDQIRPSLAIEDQPLLLSASSLHITAQVITSPLCGDRVDSIISLQARNLQSALGRPRALYNTMAMIDDALDIRHLLDPRQLQFSAGRWRRNVPFDFAQVWPLSGVASTPAPVGGGEKVSSSTDPVRDHSGATWMAQTLRFEHREGHLRRLDEVLTEYAARALQRYLCVLAPVAGSAREVRVQWHEAVPVGVGAEGSGTDVKPSVTKDLVSLLLEYVSGHHSGPLAIDAQLLKKSGAALTLQTDLINHLLTQSAREFTERYIRDFNEMRTGVLRQGNQHVQPSVQSAHLRTDVMLLDLAIGKRQKRIDGQASGMIAQVLARPAFSLRTGLAESKVQAFSLSLSYGTRPAFTLCDTLVLKQPLKPGSPVVLWSSLTGWRQFPSMPRLKHALKAELAGVARERWLVLMGKSERNVLRKHLGDIHSHQVQFDLEDIQGNVFDAMQRQIVESKQQDLRELCFYAGRCRLSGSLFNRLARAIELDEPLSDMVDALTLRVDACMFEALLPPWISSASLSDLRLYNELWRRYYQATDDGKDFLFDIASLEEYARQRLASQLALDFPAQSVNPDSITVVSRRYVSTVPPVGMLPSALPAAIQTQRESLAQFAINRFADNQGAILSIEWAPSCEPVSAITLAYVRELVRRVDVATGYTTLLHKALAPADPQYAMRNRLFVRQLPPMLLALALPEKLRGNLSAQAYAFISSIVEMPDALARKQVDGISVILSPLQLVADTGMTPDRVAGLYLMCPAAGGEGPVVLYATYHAAFTFREYANLGALMEDICQDVSLQHLLLARMEPEVRKRYEHGGFSEPHLPFSVESSFDVPFGKPGPVLPGLAEVKGNALQFLFDSTVKLLLDTGVSNAVSNDQADQASRAFLATLGFEQVLAFLPGKLSALVTLWQGHTLIRASAAAVAEHRWGKALSEFSAALGVMVSAREQRFEQEVEGSSSNREHPDIGDKAQMPSVYAWGNRTLNADQRMRLHGLEAVVSLNELSHDKVRNLYLNGEDETLYAVVEGKVYQVKALTDAGQWIIVGADGSSGPRLTVDAQLRWRLDVGLGLRGGGGAIGKFREGKAIGDAESVMLIEASGMSEIRLQYRDRARRIGEAHRQARRYLENSLDNLYHHRGPAGGLDPRAKGVLGDFFGTPNPGQPLVAEVEHTVKVLFNALMDPSLSPFSSTRFVVGTMRQGHDSIVAFTVEGDPRKRIFLSEHFFHTPTFSLNADAAVEGFDAALHHRATNLIHELSHLELDTHDVAYLESMAPYPDLLSDNSIDNVAMRARVESLQDNQLSHRTRKSALFTVIKQGSARDMEKADGAVFDAVLRLTGTTTLKDARDVFMSDEQTRHRVILANADSVALLVVKLGRRNFQVPYP